MATAFSADDISLIKQILCPPGMGVFTVNTAKERKESLHQQLFGSTTLENVLSGWEETLREFDPKNDIGLLGVCSDTGGGILRGANWGPLFIREAALKLGAIYKDLGDVRVNPHLLHDKYLNEATLAHVREAFYDDSNSSLPVSPLSITQEFCQNFYERFGEDGRLLSYGGDHSVSYALVYPFLEMYKKNNRKAGVLHFDAHTDLLEKRLGIDLCFGSWATHVLPLMSDRSNFIQVGIRSTGKTKQHWESEFGVQQFWAEESMQLGPKELAKNLLEHWKSKGVEDLYLSFDIDAIDQSFVQATGTPEPGGLTPDFCYELIELIGADIRIQSADIVEVSPFLVTDKTQKDETVGIAAKLAKQFSNILSV